MQDPTVLPAVLPVLDKPFVTMFRLHRTARSSTSVFVDLLLACYLANTTCAIMNIMATLIFIILIVSRLHAFFVVVPVRSSLHVLVVVAVISYFQQGQGTAMVTDGHPAHACLGAAAVASSSIAVDTLNKHSHTKQTTIMDSSPL